MKLSNKKSIQEITMAMVKLGLRNVIISPGSRNAPLTISFNQHPQLNCISIRDERSAGFFALGKALQLKEPVALLCTSGSAALNFAPAIVEAFYLRIPLIVITADRPAEWIDQGDGQTIRQNNIYNNFIRKSYIINGEAQSENERWHNLRNISEGFAIATTNNPGPVHFNVPVNEPLYGQEEVNTSEIRVFKQADINPILSNSELEFLQAAFSESKKVMILVGQNPPDAELNHLLAELAEFENVIILTESTSNVRHPDFISNIDRLITPLREEELEDFMPEIVISFAAAIVSKRIKGLIRKHKPQQHWNIHSIDSHTDTFSSLTRAIPLSAEAFLSQFLNGLEKKTGTYKRVWRDRAELLEEKHRKFVSKLTFSDFLAFENIFKNIPGGINLHLANSSPIRYAQLFNCDKINAVHTNRGTSGIDGCTSTAVGAAESDPENPYLLITGDIAFFYDINALWNDKFPSNLKIIIINNSGGGIFRIVNGPSETGELEEFFETKQNRSAKGIVESFGLKYISANDEKSLEKGLTRFFNSSENITVLEIFTPNEQNPEILKSYFTFLESNS